MGMTQQGAKRHDEENASMQTKWAVETRRDRTAREFELLLRGPERVLVFGLESAHHLMRGGRTKRKTPQSREKGV
jgi:hypothetical protein